MVEIARRVGRYRLERQLGAGGMGVVHEAFDETLGRRVAVKILPPDLLGDTERRRRFVREAKSAAAVQHRAIAAVFDAGEAENGEVFIVMELVQGETLREVIARAPIPVREAVAFAAEIARGLVRAHEAGIVHRDLKPENVLVDRDGQVKILDFGLACATDDSAVAGDDATRTALTEEGRILGTPGYMAPEQCLGERADARADLFAVGVILFELLSGQPPFAGKTSIERIVATTRDEPPALGDLCPGVPLELVALIGRLLAKKREQRPASASALLLELEAVPSGTSAPTLPNGPPPVSTSASRPHPRGRRWAIAAASLALLGIATALALRAREAPAAPALDLTSVIACPQFEVKGSQAPPGNLGAAVADMACTTVGTFRDQWDGERRTLTPARLLELPVRGAADYPESPFAAKDARERSIAAAKKADAWLDGAVVVDREAFRVEITLRRGDVAVKGPSRAAARTAREAAWTAVRGLLGPDGIAKSELAHGIFPDFYGCTTTDCVAEAWFMTFDIADATDPAPGCRALAEKHPDALPGVAFPCAGILGASAYERWKEIDRSSDTAFLRSIAAGRGTRSPAASLLLAEEMAKRPRAANAAAQRFWLFQEAALRLAGQDVAGARGLAMRGIDLLPESCVSRAIELASAAITGSSERGSALAFTAWCPERTDAWTARRTFQTAPSAADSTLTYELLGRTVNAAVLVGWDLLGEGRADELRALASYHQVGAPADHAPPLDALLAFADWSDTRLKASLDRSERRLLAMDRLPRGSLQNMAGLLRLGALLLERSDRLDAIIERFVLGPAPLLDPAFFEGELGVLCAAASAPVAKRCTQRARELRANGGLFAVPGGDAYWSGLEKAASGDVNAAVDAWRPLLSSKSWTFALDPRVFDAGGLADAAEDLDRKQLATLGAMPGPIEPRRALRAEKRGDIESAKKLARETVHLFRNADVTVPVVEEMKALLARHGS